jgi:hypothetical protein
MTKLSQNYYLEQQEMVGQILHFINIVTIKGQHWQYQKQMERYLEDTLLTFGKAISALSIPTHRPFYLQLITIISIINACLIIRM